MATVVTINCPDVVALIEKAADEITGGNKTELVATAVRRLLEETGRSRPLFGAHPGSKAAEKSAGDGSAARYAHCPLARQRR
jgi:hypothetical protein